MGVRACHCPIEPIVPSIKGRPGRSSSDCSLDGLLTYQWHLGSAPADGRIWVLIDVIMGVTSTQRVGSQNTAESTTFTRVIHEEGEGLCGFGV